MVSMKIAFYAGLILSSPAWIYFLLQFLLPGLTASEKKWIEPVLVTLFISASLALVFSLKTALPAAVGFFAAYNAPFGENLWTLSSYISFVLTLSFALLVGSQLVGLFFLLVHFGIFSYAQLKRSRKGTYLGAFILGALLTPPDVPSQLAMAIFLIGFFELFLFYAKIRRKLFPPRGF